MHSGVLECASDNLSLCDGVLWYCKIARANASASKPACATPGSTDNPLHGFDGCLSLPIALSVGRRRGDMSKTHTLEKLWNNLDVNWGP